MTLYPTGHFGWNVKRRNLMWFTSLYMLLLNGFLDVCIRWLCTIFWSCSSPTRVLCLRRQSSLSSMMKWYDCLHAHYFCNDIVPRCCFGVKLSLWCLTVNRDCVRRKEIYLTVVFSNSQIFQDPTAMMQQLLTTSRQLTLGAYKHETECTYT